MLTIPFYHVFSSFSLILIPQVVAEISNSITELVIPIRIPTNKAKAEIGIHSVKAEAKIRRC